MEGNGRVPSPPSQAISFYSYDRPNQPYRHIVANSTYPVTISVCNGIKLFFTITNHSVSIISPNDNAPHLHRIITDYRQHLLPQYNNQPQHHNSDHNGAQDELFFLHMNGYRDNNGAQSETLFLPDQNNNAAQDIDLFREEEEEEDEELEEDDIRLIQFHGLVLPHLPALPAYIHVTTNNRTFALLVTVNNTIHVMNQAVPIFPPHNNDGNCHVINQPIAPPFSMGVYFNRANNNTFIDIRIEIINNNSIFITADSCIGTSDWAAILDFIPARPHL
ncbi:hypothetical protein Lal_00003515 [Lupinus albus]|nr:hypothetical protein Lal_00003515 [Lupinus albus]